MDFGSRESVIQPLKNEETELRVARNSNSRGVEKREEILRSALDLIFEDGFQNQTLRTIGTMIGVEAAHILYYFKSSMGLFTELMRYTDAHARSDLKVGENSLNRFVAAVRNNVQGEGMLVLYFHLLCRALEKDEVAAPYVKQRFELVRTGLAAAIRQEQIAGSMPGDLDPVRCARQLIALADGLQIQALLDPEINPADDLSDAIARLRCSADTT